MIDRMNLHQTIIRPSNDENSFLGSIDWLIVHRHGESIDQTNYPFYRNVRSYGVSSETPYSMDLRGFDDENNYKNLRSMRIDDPQFEVYIDRLIPSLSFLSLNVERFHERNVESARHIERLQLGSKLRRFDLTLPLKSLFVDLKELDLSSIDVSLLDRDSRCRLINYIDENFDARSVIVLPRTREHVECQCSSIYFDRLAKRKNDLDEDDRTCLDKCRFTDCARLRSYFIDRFNRISPARQEEISSSFDFHWDSFDENLAGEIVQFEQQRLWTTDKRWPSSTRARTQPTINSTQKPMINSKTDRTIEEILLVAVSICLLCVFLFSVCLLVRVRRIT